MIERIRRSLQRYSPGDPRTEGSLSVRVASRLIALTPTKDRHRTTDWVEGTYPGRQYPEAAAMPRSLTTLHSIQERLVDGVRTITVRPRKGATRLHIIYTHGGVYINELSRPHWWIVAELIRRTGATVTVPLYRLAPESTYREVFPYLTSVYREVLLTSDADDVVLAGDSAGGGLAIAQCWAFTGAGLPMPSRIIAFSPWLDVTGTNPDVPRYEKIDPMLSVPGAVRAGSWWAGGDDPRTPLVSPACAPADMLGSLPPIRIYQGTRDVCMPDAVVFRDRALEAGADVVLREYPGAFHVFPGLPWLPESRAAYADLADWLGRPALP
ncbi:acetyl esterase/lipase [Arthrobacter sp. CAN_A6]|uniref:alpha/beta hydrolase n=1 Tax=Arthrobacter sp. CAN_A6 TaxID=2787721 RepID=UPI0018CA9F33